MHLQCEMHNCVLSLKKEHTFTTVSVGMQYRKLARCELYVLWKTQQSLLMFRLGSMYMDVSINIHRGL